MVGVPSLSKHLHPPMNYSEFLKRNEDALFIRVVGGGQTPTTACYFIFTEHLQWRRTNTNHGVLLYFYLTPAMAEMLYLFLWLVEGKHQPRRVALFLSNTCNGGKIN
jgi:hypothetical protein